MNARVLVVDDDEMVRKVMVRWLARTASYEAVGVSSVEEALALLAAGERFDVIVCDRVMPTVKTASDLVAEAPKELKNRVILTSGGKVTGSDPLLGAVQGRFFPKSGTTKELAEMIERVIAEEGRIT